MKKNSKLLLSTITFALALVLCVLASAPWTLNAAAAENASYMPSIQWYKTFDLKADEDYQHIGLSDRSQLLRIDKRFILFNEFGEDKDLEIVITITPAGDREITYGIMYTAGGVMEEAENKQEFFMQYRLSDGRYMVGKFRIQGDYIYQLYSTFINMYLPESDIMPGMRNTISAIGPNEQILGQSERIPPLTWPNMLSIPYKKSIANFTVTALNQQLSNGAYLDVWEDFNQSLQHNFRMFGGTNDNAGIIGWQETVDDGQFQIVKYNTDNIVSGVSRITDINAISILQNAERLGHPMFTSRIVPVGDGDYLIYNPDSEGKASKVNTSLSNSQVEWTKDFPGGVNDAVQFTLMRPDIPGHPDSEMVKRYFTAVLSDKSKLTIISDRDASEYTVALDDIFLTKSECENLEVSRGSFSMVVKQPNNSIILAYFAEPPVGYSFPNFPFYFRDAHFMRAFGGNWKKVADFFRRSYRIRPEDEETYEIEGVCAGMSLTAIKFAERAYELGIWNYVDRSVDLNPSIELYSLIIDYFLANTFTDVIENSQEQKEYLQNIAKTVIDNRRMVDIGIIIEDKSKPEDIIYYGGHAIVIYAYEGLERRGEEYWHRFIAYDPNFAYNDYYRFQEDHRKPFYISQDFYDFYYNPGNEVIDENIYTIYSSEDESGIYDSRDELRTGRTTFTEECPKDEDGIFYVPPYIAIRLKRLASISLNGQNGLFYRVYSSDGPPDEGYDGEESQWQIFRTDEEAGLVELSAAPDEDG
ncbi:MAG: hypothetical protein FWH55_10460, partial [Oscillospiraceae bacterium]|nr:hypothetical protein [Oscillospiraceae bacterium]